MNKYNIYIQESLKYLLRNNLLLIPFLRRVKNLYNLTEEELYRWNERRFLKIFKTAITKSAFYKELYKAHNVTINDITSLKDIVKLPVIDKEMIKKNPEQLLTIPRFLVYKTHTSGTTGTPLTLYNDDYLSVLRAWAYTCFYRRRAGFRYGERLVSLRGHLGYDIFKVKLHISNTLYLSSYQIYEKTAERYYHEIRMFKPKAIEGYPSSLYNLCCCLKDKSLRLSVPICFTSSETLFDFQKELIEDILDTEIYDIYGNTERTISLSECMDHRGYYSEPGFSINEFYNDGIITTSLLGSSFPLIRYRISDTVSLVSMASFSNSELCIVKSIDGRIEDTIIAKDGSRIGRLDHLFKNLNNIRISQIIQNEKGKITINIVPDGEFPEIEKQKLLKNINERMGLDNIDVTISIVDKSKIIYTQRNKFRLVISTINNDIPRG